MKCIILIATCLVVIFSIDAAQYPVPLMNKGCTARTRRKAQQQILPLYMQFEKVEDIHGIKLTVPGYKIKTVNGRRDQIYNMVSMDLSGKYRDEGEYVINDRGELQKPGEDGAYVAILQGYQPAERVRYYLISKDRKQKNEYILVPWPIEKKNTFGHTLRAELINLNYTAFEVVAEGYQPGEPIRVLTYISGKVIERKGNATRHGTFNYLLMPITQTDEDGGQLTFAIEGVNSSNSVKLPWGIEFREKGEEFIKKKNEEFAQLKKRLFEIGTIDHENEKRCANL